MRIDFREIDASPFLLPLVFLLVYILRGGFLSGWRGIFYALQRLTAEVLLSLFLIDVKLQSLTPKSDTNESE